MVFQAQSQRVNRERYLTTLEAKVDKLQSLLIKQIYINNQNAPQSSTSSPMPSPLPSMPSPEPAVGPSWQPAQSELLMGRTRLSTIPSVGTWEEAASRSPTAGMRPEDILPPPEASLSPVPGGIYPGVQVCGSSLSSTHPVDYPTEDV